MDVWQCLDIAPTLDRRLIKQAYARQLKQHNPEDDPEGFKVLRACYEKALVLAASRRTAESVGETGAATSPEFTWFAAKPGQEGMTGSERLEEYVPDQGPTDTETTADQRDEATEPRARTTKVSGQDEQEAPTPLFDPVDKAQWLHHRLLAALTQEGKAGAMACFQAMAAEDLADTATNRAFENLLLMIEPEQTSKLPAGLRNLLAHHYGWLRDYRHSDGQGASIISTLLLENACKREQLRVQALLVWPEPPPADLLAELAEDYPEILATESLPKPVKKWQRTEGHKVEFTRPRLVILLLAVVGVCFVLLRIWLATPEVSTDLDLNDDMFGPSTSKVTRSSGNLNEMDLQQLMLFNKVTSSPPPWQLGMYSEARRTAAFFVSLCSVVLLEDSQGRRMIGIGKNAFTVGAGPWQGMAPDITMPVQKDLKPFLVRVIRRENVVIVTNIGPPGVVCLVDQFGGSGPPLAEGAAGLTFTGTLAVAGVQLKIMPALEWFKKPEASE